MADKPLGRKAYGSIGHIIGSRLGPGDHSVPQGQTDICLHGAPGKTVYVQTKLDGSCVSAAKLEDGSIVALGRAGYLATTSHYEMHHLWAHWVRENEALFQELLQPGERIVGEWLSQAHGTIYNLGKYDPFVAFDIMVEDKRMLTEDFYRRAGDLFNLPDMLRLVPAPDEDDPTETGFQPPQQLITMLDDYGADEPEGVVYRVESVKNGQRQLDFLAKWVRPDKEDGKYLKNDPPIWNWRP